MSSILTNNSANVALQTLRMINSQLAETQDNIANGVDVTASNNSSIWAVSKVMQSDVDGMKTIASSLSLGQSTVAVASTAAETVTDLLGKIKEKIVTAQGENVDRTKLQTDIDKIRDQIKSVVGAAQFNGLNLVDGSAASVEVLSSLNRTASGVTTSSITVAAQDLSTGDYVASDIFSNPTLGIVSADGDGFVTSLTKGGGFDSIDILNTGTWAAGDRVSITIGNKTASYTVTESDLGALSTPDDLVAIGLKNAIDNLKIDGLTVDYDSNSPGSLAFTNDGTADLSVSGQFKNAGSGGLSLLSTIDVSTGPNAKAALDNIEGLIQIGIDATAAFGSAQGQLKLQTGFISKMIDSMQAGVSTLIETDMEAESAKLQALQVRQQLAIQSLSIANQAPQAILALFR